MDSQLFGAVPSARGALRELELEIRRSLRVGDRIVSRDFVAAGEREFDAARGHSENCETSIRIGLRTEADSAYSDLNAFGTSARKVTGKVHLA